MSEVFVCFATALPLVIHACLAICLSLLTHGRCVVCIWCCAYRVRVNASQDGPPKYAIGQALNVVDLSKAPVRAEAKAARTPPLPFVFEMPAVTRGGKRKRGVVSGGGGRDAVDVVSMPDGDDDEAKHADSGSEGSGRAPSRRVPSDTEKITCARTIYVNTIVARDAGGHLKGCSMSPRRMQEGN